MGLAYSLAETLNIAWGLAAGDVRTSIAQRLADRCLRERLAKKVAAGLDGASGIDAGLMKRLLGDPDFFAFVANPFDSDLLEMVDDGRLEELLGADSSSERLDALGRSLAMVVEAAVVGRATPPERLLLARIGEVSQTQVEVVRIVLDVHSRLDTLVGDVAKAVREDTRGTSVAAAGRFDVPPLPRAMVARSAKRDEAVEVLLGGSTVTVTSMSFRGAGGVGKTVLAQQVGHDQRIRDAYPGGVWWLEVGQHPDLEQLAERLYRRCSGGRQPAAGVSVVAQLADVMGNQPVLVLLDDVWAPTDVVETLLAGLPANVHTLITTRGVELPGSQTVSVDELSVEEARHILLGNHSATADPEVIRSADTLSRLLGHWALLVAMASAAARPSLTGPAKQAVAALEGIASDFRADPTVLDDEDSRERSFARLVERSETSLRERASDADRDVQRFWELGVYPPDAVLEIELLADLWVCRPTEATRWAQRIAEVGLATLVPPTDTRPLTLVLHDLIVDYLHRRRCRPGQFPNLHRRCATPAIGLDGRPRAVTPARAAWLVHHLLAAGEWHRLEGLATLEWRRAFLNCTGSDATLFDTLDVYAKAALDYPEPEDAARHYFNAVLFAAHIRALIGQIPIAVLTTTALLGNPIAALTQAAHRPDAGVALPAVLETALRTGPFEHVLRHAIQLANSIPDERLRSRALAGIVHKVAANHSRAGYLVKQAVDAAKIIPHDRDRSEALAGIAQKIAEDPSRAEWAIELANTIPDDRDRSEALAGIAQKVVEDPSRAEWAIELANTMPDDGLRSRVLAEMALKAAEDPSRVEWAVQLATTIPRDWDRSEALADIAQMAAEDPSRVEWAVELATTIPIDGCKSQALVGCLRSSRR